jgi:hypothetical protein
MTDPIDSFTAPATAQPSSEDDLQAKWQRVDGRRSFLKGVGLAGAAARSRQGPVCRRSRTPLVRCVADARGS